MSNVTMFIPKNTFEGKFRAYVPGKCLYLALSPPERIIWTS